MSSAGSLARLDVGGDPPAGPAPVASCQYLREGAVVASDEFLRLSRWFHRWFTAGSTGAACLAVAMASSWPVRARICRERAAGRVSLYWAFIRITGIRDRAG